MDKIRFTAGEWKIREFKGDSWPDNRISIGPEDDHKATAVAISPRYAEREQMLADAHLIAAAPDMYVEIRRDIENLKQLLCDMHPSSLEYAATVRKIERKTSLLSKARGDKK